MVSDSHLSEPARRLLAAIVRRAVFDFVLYCEVEITTNKEHYQIAIDAAEWLFSGSEELETEEGGYTFTHICRLLVLDPANIRRRALLLSREDISKINNTEDPDVQR